MQQTMHGKRKGGGMDILSDCAGVQCNVFVIPQAAHMHMCRRSWSSVVSGAALFVLQACPCTAERVGAIATRVF